MDAVPLGGNLPGVVSALKFTGQILIPDLDHPGVRAVVLIEENQTELLMEGESLGRWSLVDVRADRLIANAFSLALGNEEVTFLADEPVDFAYRGVDEMANVWARYRAMTLPRRMVASRRSRSGTKPSRIGHLRAAMVDNLEMGAGAGIIDTPPVHRATPQPSPPTPDAPKVTPPSPPPAAAAAPAGLPPQVEEEQAISHVPATGSGPQPVEPEVPSLPAEDRHSPPGRGDRPSIPEAVSSGDPADTVHPVESVFKETVPWLTPQKNDIEAEASAAPGPEATYPEGIFVPPADTPADEIEDLAPEDLGPEDSTSPEGDSPPATVPPPPPAAPDTPKRFVVDLGAFEDQEQDRPDVHESFEPALAGAAEKGGIMGAVKAAFVRGRPEHGHEYVVAPGGIGITRHICTECGHISIGTSD